MSTTSTRSLHVAIDDFHKARQRGQLQRLFGRLTGNSADLLSYEEVAAKLRATGRTDRGLRVIPVEAIVGSVGRYTDFTRTFLPRNKSDAERWASVKSAGSSLGELPPIEVYQLGEAYFVLDGNHRVSIAKLQDVSFIDAHVIEVQTRVPFKTGDDPNALIIKAEQAEFLASTQLDKLRPDSELELSAPGQYARLENLIEVHRYFIEAGEGVELTDEEAAARWHDEAYLPVVEAVREQGILRHFPNRTETDFYVWLASHQAELRNELGWEMRPESAVAKLAGQFEPKKAGLVTRLRKEIRGLVVPDRRKGDMVPATWSEQRALDRYSDRLFADILVPVGAQASHWHALEQAIVIAAPERAEIHGLRVFIVSDEPSEKQVANLRQVFAKRCEDAGLKGGLTLQVGEEIQSILDRSGLADLVVVGHLPRLEAKDAAVLNPAVKMLVERSCAPVLHMSEQSRSIDKVLLAYNEGAKAREALFVAAYLAERWGVTLLVLSVVDANRPSPKILDHVAQYLAMHEVAAELVYTKGDVAADVLRKAADQDSDLIIMGAHDAKGSGRQPLGGNVQRVLRESRRHVLICT